MDWQVEKKKERTERHQWSIVCSQDDLSNSSRSQYIKQTQIYYTICSDMFYKYKLHHLCFFGLIKEQFCIQGNVCEYTAHIHTTLPPKVWYVSNHFQCRKGKKKKLFKMNTAVYYSLKTIQVHIVTTVCNSNSSGSASTPILQRIWYAVAHDGYLSPWYRLDYKCFPNTGNIR